MISGFAGMTMRLLAALCCFFLASARLSAAAPTGPTLHFDYADGNPLADPLHQFMYFVPLISPEPVSVFTSADNTQRARLLSFRCRTNGVLFSAVCEFEFSGQGSQQNVFDHAALIQKREAQLKAGTSLKRRLGSINVEGSGNCSVEIEGALTNGQPVVANVRMRFNGHGHASAVNIILHDICWRDGSIRFENELVAQVNTLNFRRQTGPPKMEVTLASVKRKDAGNGFWQKFVGSLKGAAANLFLPPLTVTADGHQTMLDFGLALATKKPEFTFPLATRLKETPATTP